MWTKEQHGDETWYYSLNRKSWGEGPWDAEPDKIAYRDPESGYDCIIRRNTMGALCGYVGLPESHPLYNRRYNEPIFASCIDEDGELDLMDNYEFEPYSFLHVHGCITYSGRSLESTGEESSLPPDKYWYGFDCSHYRDLSPYMQARDLGSSEDVYRDVNYVKAEIASLAKQLKRFEALKLHELNPDTFKDEVTRLLSDID